MKRGDIVTIMHESWSTRSIINGKLINEWTLCCNTDKNQDNEYIVIETDCTFPNTGSQLPVNKPTCNNTVIQNIISGKVVFIEERFLRLKHSAPLIREVTMSEVCKQFGEEVKIKKE